MAFNHPPQLDENDRNALLSLARSTLVAAFRGDAHGPLRAFELTLSQSSQTLLEPHPCFVAIMSMGIQLRGCIGTLQTDSPLYQNIHEYTLKAAFSDPRFPPLKEEELDSVHLEITVLGPTLPLPNRDAIKIGTHGLVVQSHRQRGVLLAHVATEWGWDKDEFIRQTCIKADLDPEQWEKYDIFYFEEQVFKESI